ncbi:major facilitator superfamily transporter [Ceratobasidium sp. AG-Ba]|nr:major facilitator superfamily transporter [Ceratobasidium sp. AG-Ba]
MELTPNTSPAPRKIKPTITSDQRDDHANSNTEPSRRKSARFWLIFLALCVSTFLSALELTSVSTALPTIVGSLKGHEFAWVGRPIILLSHLVFAIGSAIAGASKSTDMLIAGRTLQGIGGGGIITLTDIIVADLVPLAERGPYLGIVGAVWAVAGAIGPPIGGAFAEKNWRWLFYMNLPIAGAAMVLVFAFLRLNAPRQPFKQKMARIDWVGNVLVIGSTALTIIALTWAGARYSWSSVHVLVPLIVDLIGLIAALAYEFTLAVEPIIPRELLSNSVGRRSRPMRSYHVCPGYVFSPSCMHPGSGGFFPRPSYSEPTKMRGRAHYRPATNRTSFSGYMGIFFHGIVMTAVVYYLPVYFQASRGDPPIKSGIDVFGMAFTVAPFGVFTGISTVVFKKYRPQNYVAWILVGIGAGILFASTTFAVLAPLPVSRNAPALALFAFVRTFASTYGVAIGSSVLQTELAHSLPVEFSAQFPGGSDIAFAAIPLIGKLDDPLRSQVRAAFADALAVLWQVMIGISGMGLLSVVLMKEIEMNTQTDEKWAMEQR